MKKFILVVACMFSLKTFATQEPMHYSEDVRIKHVTFSKHNVVPIYGAPFTASQLLFGSDEVVIDVEGGDSQGWMVTFQKSLPNMLFVKPTVLDSNSNMTVVTNKHTYYFNAISNEHTSPTYAIHFSYPEEVQKYKQLLSQQESRVDRALRLYQKSPKQFNWNYDFNGDNRIKPHYVFDDGVFTYIKLYPNQDVPAVFAVNNKRGEEAIVNINSKEDFLIIHQVAPQLTLRSGKYLVASLFNNRTIRFIKGVTHV